MKGQNYIGGAWREGAVPFETINPSDLDEVVGQYTKAAAADVEEAMDVARRALPAWRSFNMQARSDLLRRIGFSRQRTNLRGRADDFQRIAQPLHGRTRDEDRAFECVGALAFELVRDGRKQAVTRHQALGPGIE